MKKKKSEKSRREFLENGLAVGAGLTLGWTMMPSDGLNGDKEKVRLITKDGKVVEVDRRFLPKPSGKKLSNEELKDWLS